MTTHLLRAAVASLTVLGVLATAGCAGADPSAGLVRAEVAARSVPLDEAAALAQVVAATRRLGTGTLALAPAGENAVISPSSLAVALAMLAEGARTTSLAELDVLLGATGEDRRDAFAALRGALLTLDGDPADATADELPDRPIVHLADQVVVDEGFEVNQPFLDALADVFDAGVQVTDLGSPDGKKVLDAWVNHHTGGLIEKSAIEPEPDLRLVLQDAILLAARWQTPFLAASTSERPFTLPDGSSVDVETMFSSEGQFAFAEVDGWQAVRLPYQEALSADVVLPPAGTDPATATPELLAALSDELGRATPGLVELTLPTLDIGPQKLNLLDILAELGVASVTCDNPGTDLSGIALGPGDLCVSQAFQQAVLQVDEEGTVAAAVTEIGIRESAAPMPEHAIYFDRPFLFSVSHTATDWPLFLAAVRDPRH